MNRPAYVIAFAQADDLAGMTALLVSAGLVADDIGTPGRQYLVARDGAAVVGTVGAEVHAPDALLRSLAVAPAHRGAGVGTALLRRLDAAAMEWGVQRWWLLTTTAEAYFRRRGFAAVPRSEAPESIRRTGQFSGGVCATAACLTRARKDGP